MALNQAYSSSLSKMLATFVLQTCRLLQAACMLGSVLAASSHCDVVTGGGHVIPPTTAWLYHSPQRHCLFAVCIASVNRIAAIMRKPKAEPFAGGAQASLDVGFPGNPFDAPAGTAHGGLLQTPSLFGKLPSAPSQRAYQGCWHAQTSLPMYATEGSSQQNALPAAPPASGGGLDAATMSAKLAAAREKNRLAQQRFRCLLSTSAQIEWSSCKFTCC
jgi:hypothetical protein